MYFIYGDGGTGKTTLFKQFPGHKVLFSFDLSTNPIKPEDNTDVITFDEADSPSIQKLVDASVRKLIAKKEYAAIALDNVTALQNLVLENIDDASKDGRANYQKLQLWFRRLGVTLRHSGTMIYETAHQLDKTGDDMTGKGRFEPDMNMRTFNAFTATFDMVGRIYKKDGARMINTDPEQGDHGKNRVDDRTIFKAEDLLAGETNEGVK